jgi:protein-disulfide isomerase
MLRRDRLDNVFTAVLVLCAVAVTIRYYTAAPPAPRNPALERRRIEAWDSLLNGGQMRGPSGATVTIVEFGDFECPACRTAFPLVKTVLDRYPDEIRMVYHHYPLPYHRHALPAARAAECAGKQGRFWATHDVLFRNQDSLGAISFTAFGDSANVPDRRAYAHCLQDTTTLAAVETGNASAARSN